MTDNPKSFVRPLADEEHLDWSRDPSIACHGQAGIAAYQNFFGRVVIRQQNVWEEDGVDTFISLHPEYLPNLIEALTSLQKKISAENSRTTLVSAASKENR